MATEIVRWCDHHLVTEDKRVGADAHTITLDGTTHEVDLCIECFKGMLSDMQPILDHARRTAGPAAKKPSTPKVPQSIRTCPICGAAGMASTQTFNRHLRESHGKTATDVFGLRCPLCGAEARSLSGLGTHAFHAHHEGSVPGLFDLARSEKDPLGVIKARGLN